MLGQPASLCWHTDEPSGKVVCTLCPRECHIPSGGRGFCFVRANEDGKLVLTTYGRSSGFCVDPVEKKPLHHFLPGTPILSLGAAGCNLGCKFCQNWGISKSREMDMLGQSASPRQIVALAQGSGCPSIALTYNDPVIWAEYAIDIARAARRQGLKTVAVTAGYISAAARSAFFENMDAANVDLKGFTEKFYRKLCQGRLQPVLDTLVFLKRRTNVWLELTTLLIPGENDHEHELRDMSRWVLDHLGHEVPLHFTAFHPDFKMLHTPATPHPTLLRARQIAVEAGLKFVYVGNVHDPKHSSTYCPECGQLLVERHGFELRRYAMKGDRCGFCGSRIAGVFHPLDATLRPWGGRRLPLRIVQGEEA